MDAHPKDPLAHQGGGAPSEPEDAKPYGRHQEGGLSGEAAAAFEPHSTGGLTGDALEAKHVLQDDQTSKSDASDLVTDYGSSDDDLTDSDCDDEDVAGPSTTAGACASHAPQPSSRPSLPRGSGSHALAHAARSAPAAPAPSPQHKTLRRKLKLGVTRSKQGRYESRCVVRQGASAEEVRLGIFDTENQAALAHDLVAVKDKGGEAITNFPISDYQEEIDNLESVTEADLLLALQRQARRMRPSKFGHYFGVGWSCRGYWRPAIRVEGKNQPAGPLTKNEKEAAISYDKTAVRHLGWAACTNFDLANYVELIPEQQRPAMEALIQARGPLTDEHTDTDIRCQWVHHFSKLLFSSPARVLLETVTSPRRPGDQPSTSGAGKKGAGARRTRTTHNATLKDLIDHGYLDAGKGVISTTTETSAARRADASSSSLPDTTADLDASGCIVYTGAAGAQQYSIAEFAVLKSTALGLQPSRNSWCYVTYKDKSGGWRPLKRIRKEFEAKNAPEEAAGTAAPLASASGLANAPFPEPPAASGVAREAVQSLGEAQACVPRTTRDPPPTASVDAVPGCGRKRQRSRSPAQQAASPLLDGPAQHAGARPRQSAPADPGARCVLGAAAERAGLLGAAAPPTKRRLRSRGTAPPDAPLSGTVMAQPGTSQRTAAAGACAGAALPCSVALGDPASPPHPPLPHSAEQDQAGPSAGVRPAERRRRGAARVAVRGHGSSILPPPCALTQASPLPVGGAAACSLPEPAPASDERSAHALAQVHAQGCAQPMPGVSDGDTAGEPPQVEMQGPPAKRPRAPSPDAPRSGSHDTQPPPSYLCSPALSDLTLATELLQKDTGAALNDTGTSQAVDAGPSDQPGEAPAAAGGLLAPPSTALGSDASTQQAGEQRSCHAAACLRSAERCTPDAQPQPELGVAMGRAAPAPAVEQHAVAPRTAGADEQVAPPAATVNADAQPGDLGAHAAQAAPEGPQMDDLGDGRPVTVASRAARFEPGSPAERALEKECETVGDLKNMIECLEGGRAEKMKQLAELLGIKCGKAASLLEFVRKDSLNHQ